MREPLNPSISGRFFDLLIPAQGREWPAASAVIEDFRAIIGQIDVLELIKAVERLPEGEKTAAIAAFERENPKVFNDLLAALYRAYYSSAAVAERVKVLANSAPRDPSPYFDHKLLDQVIRTQAGKRRL